MIIHFKHSSVYIPIAIFNPCGDLQENLPFLKYHEWLSILCNSKDLTSTLSYPGFI